MNTDIPPGLASPSVAGAAVTQEAEPSPSADRKGGGTLGSWELVSFTISHAIVSTLLACLSLEGLYGFAGAFGTLEWLVNHRRRRRFVSALQRVLGRRPTTQERRRWTREYFMRSRRDKLFYLIFDRIPRDKALALFTIGNRAMLDEALQRGRGVYLAMSHHGPHHVGAMLTALSGYKVAGVRERREGAIRRYVQDRFDRLYPEFQRMRVFFADSFPRDIYRCFRDGFVLGSAMDVSRPRRDHQKTETVTIFGERRTFVSGPLRIALRCGTPVLQAFVLPGEGFRYRLEIVGPLLDPETIQDADAAIAKALRTYAANIECYIRESPSLITRI